MCGIFGRFARSGLTGDVQPLIDATNMLAHRGPDDGTWWREEPFFLGHRRLSIIDLSLGTQPMAANDGRFVIVLNGEIYNYVELREELRTRGAGFNTESDTEVALQAYRVWGTEMPNHLVGMFALAIVDRQEKSLFLARDRFGEKPLFIMESVQTITFASEFAALASLPDFDRQMDRLALCEYLCLNYVPGQRTMTPSVRRLTPGTWRLYHERSVRDGVYWSPQQIQSDASHPSIEDATDELKVRIDRSVRIAMRSDVPVTLFLSGGIDSSIVAESAARQRNLKHAYCLDFSEGGFSEWPNAAKVASKLGLELRRVVLTAEALQDIGRLLEHVDDPLGDSSALAVWTLARSVSEDYKVAVTGDGGDELFGGYLTYKATAAHQAISSVLPAVVRRRISWAARLIPATDGKVTATYKLMRFLRALDLPSPEAHFSWNGTWLPAQAAKLLEADDDAESATTVLRDLARRHRLDAPLHFGALQRVDAGDYLPNDILTKVDRMTMAHGVESRAPFLIPDVAEYALSLPDRLKSTTFGPPKRILRWLATKLYGPEIGNARKQGFSIPIHRWLRGPMRPLLEDLLSAESLRPLGLLNTQALLDAKMRHLDGRDQLGFELWGVMVLVAWHRARIQCRPRPRGGESRLREIELPLGQTPKSGRR